MNGIKLSYNEIKRILSTKMSRITIFAVILVPLLYSSLYLWAFWDPYATLDDMPVAVVNDDAGAEFGDQKLNVGNEIIDKLKSDESLGWDFIAYDVAEKGLMDDNYYLIVRIPENFSASVASAGGVNPKKAQIEFIPKESHNLLASQISKAAISELQLEVSNSITSKYLEVITNGFLDVESGFESAGTGVEKLNDALLSAKDGTAKLSAGVENANDATKKLVDGVKEVGSGAIQFTDGLNQTADGNKKIASGLETATDSLQLMKGSIKPLSEGATTFVSKIAEVDKGTDQILSGGKQVQTGIDSLQQGVRAISKGSDGIITGLDGSIETTIDIEKRIKSLLAENPSLKTDENVAVLLKELSYLNSNQGLAKLANGVKELDTGIEKIDNNLANLSSGQKKVVDSLGTLDNGFTEIANGANKLGNGILQFEGGVSELHTGISSAKENLNKIVIAEEQMAKAATPLHEGAIALQDGATELENGMNLLYTSSVKLDNGLGEIADGTDTLRDELIKGAGKVTDSNPSSSQLDLMSSPVEVVTKTINPVPNYGTGFTPYFISLALWVGTLILFLIVDINHFQFRPARALSMATSKYFTLMVIGVLQSIAISIVLHLVLGLEPTNVLLFYLFNVFLSCIFVAIIQALVTLLGEAGKFLGIVMLMLQLTSCAGTFPLELTPKFFQVINPLFPMTYAVSALKEIISGDSINLIFTDSIILLAMGVGAFLITWITFKTGLNKKLGTEERTLTA